MPSAPVPWSWPARCHRAQAAGGPDDDSQQQEEEEHALTHEQVQAWLQSLIVEGGELILPADSLWLLQGQYDLLGPLVLAAVDERLAQTPQHQSALCLAGIDLQEPLARPLRTCLEAYALQRLAVHDCNLDTAVASALGALWQPSSSSSGGSARGLLSLSLVDVFMCELAWRGLTQGLAAGCGLQALRLQGCLSCESVPLLARALTCGCSRMQLLDVSNTHLAASSSSSSSSSSQAGADAAWATLIEALAQPGSKQLQTLQADACDLGPGAAAALAALLTSKSRGGLTKLQLAHCTAIGETALQQVCAAAAACRHLRALDLSCSGASDACVRALTAGSCTSAAAGAWRVAWPKHLRRGGLPAAAGGLAELHLAGSAGVSAEAAVLLASAVASGNLRGLRELNLANCPGIGDAGAVRLAAMLSSCQQDGAQQLEKLNLSGCEVADGGAAALAALFAAGDGGADSRACGLSELRLADNHITAAGLAALAEAVKMRNSSLLLLDVSFNWAGPAAMRVVVAAAAEACLTTSSAQEQPPSHTPLIVLHECALEWWRVEAAKAVCHAAAAADVAAEAATVAAAAAAAAGVHWDPRRRGGSLSVREHPAAATAAGFADSCCSDGSSNTQQDGSGSCRTYAGSPARCVPATSALSKKRKVRSRLWPFSSHNDSSTASCSGCVPASSGLQQLQACMVGLQQAAVSPSMLRSRPDSSRASSRGASGSLLTVDPSLLGGGSDAAAGDEDGAGSCGSSNTGQAADANNGETTPDASNGAASSFGLSCIEQEASFRHQCGGSSNNNDVVLSPTRFDQQLQQQQNRAKVPQPAWGWGEPNPLFSPSPSPGRSSEHASPPLAAEEAAGAAAVLCQAAGGSSPAVPAAVVRGSLWAGSCSSESSSSSERSCAGDRLQDADAASGRLNATMAAAKGGAAMQPVWRQPCPPADKQQAPARALPPFSPRRRTRVCGGLAPGSQGICAVSSIAAAGLERSGSAARRRVGQQDRQVVAAASPAAKSLAAASASFLQHAAAAVMAGAGGALPLVAS